MKTFGSKLMIQQRPGDAGHWSRTSCKGGPDREVKGLSVSGGLDGEGLGLRTNLSGLSSCFIPSCIVLEKSPNGFKIRFFS